MKLNKKYAALTLVTTLGAAALTGCGSEEKAGGISPQQFTDALHVVMESDRAVYTKKIVQRLAKKEKVIKASEHFEDEKALALPAQMFRFGAEMVAEKTDQFTYSLQSLYPINKQNAPRTDMEKEGLQYINDNPGKNFYGEEKLGDTTYFTAIYPDVAVAPVCASCHNEHKDTPKTDFKVGDVMGGVVIRLPLKNS